MSLALSLTVLFAALLHASWNAMIKGGNDVLMDTAAIVAGAGLIAIPLAFAVPLPVPAAWPYVGASITIHVAYYALMVAAYRVGDLSFVYPLMRGVAPLVTALLGIVWLDETPHTVTWFGMLLVSGGVIALALRTVDHAPPRRALAFALANAVVIAAYTIVDGRGARMAGDTAFGYIVWLFLLDALPFLLWLAATRGRAAFVALWQRRTRGLVGGGLSAGAYAISVWAMTQAPVALVASLRETSVLFATLIGARLLRERLTGRRWAGVAAVVVGVMCLKAA